MASAWPFMFWASACTMGPNSMALFWTFTWTQSGFPGAALGSATGAHAWLAVWKRLWRHGGRNGSDSTSGQVWALPAQDFQASPHLLTSLRQGRDPLSGTWRWWPGGQEPDSCCEGVMGHMKEARAGASTREKPGVQKFLPRPGAGSPQRTPHPGVGSLFLTGCLPLTALTLGVHQDDLVDAKSHSRPQPHLEPRAVLARIFF